MSLAKPDFFVHICKKEGAVLEMVLGGGRLDWVGRIGGSEGCNGTSV